MRRNKKVKVVVGLGKTGLSCVRYLVRQGCEVVVLDSRQDPPGLEELRRDFPQVELHLGSFAPEVLAQAAEVIVSPGVALKQPGAIDVIGDIELFARAATAPIIAITGTNGKSSVTVLVAAMAERAGLNVRVGGNIGTPALDLLAGEEPDLYVLELSSFQLETTYSLQTAAAVLLNISMDHMDRYDSLEQYLAAKLRIYSKCDQPIINRDAGEIYYNVSGVSFGLNKPGRREFGVSNNYLVYGAKKLLSLNKLPRFRADYQISNALAALALGAAVELPMKDMLQALIDFRGLPHRCYWLARADEVDWYNDSKGTNVAATKAALIGLGEAIEGKIILIAGGQGKDADFTELYDVVKEYVRIVVLMGEDAKKIAVALRGAADICYVASMHEAVAFAKREAHEEDLVLLSPACASFDMFDNFEHRGEVFAEEVLQQIILVDE